MITMPNQTNFIPLLNIYPQPIIPAIYLPGIIHPYIPYNFVNYPQCDNFPHYSDPYDEKFAESNSLPPGLASPEDEVFYFHEFFFSKDDPGLEYYTEALAAAENYENMLAAQQKAIELSSLTMSIINSIWTKQQYSDNWGEISMYKGQDIHHNEWKSLLIDFFQDQKTLKSSEQMAKVICKLLESSTNTSRFQKYCRNNPVHTISENYEEFDLVNELKRVLNDEYESAIDAWSPQLNVENQETPKISKTEIKEGIKGKNNQVIQVIKDLDLKKELEIKRKIQEIIAVLTGCQTILVENTDIQVNNVEKVLSGLEKLVENMQTMKSEGLEREDDMKENKSANCNAEKKKGYKKILERKNYSNEPESLASDSDQGSQVEEKGRVKIQNYKEFQEDQDTTNYDWELDIPDNNDNVKTLADEERINMKSPEKPKRKKARKNRKKKANKKAAEVEVEPIIKPISVFPPMFGFLNERVPPKPSMLPYSHYITFSVRNNPDEDNKSESLNEDGDNKNNVNNASSIPEEKEEKEEKELIILKDHLIKDDCPKNQNSTLTGETSVKTETDISTEYEECKQEASTQTAPKVPSKQIHQQVNEEPKVELEEQNTRQIDHIQSPKSGTNAENEYYLDMLSNILSEDPNALDRLKDMLLSHSLGLPSGFTEEELQEIEEVNSELEKVMKRRFRDEEEDESHLPAQIQEDKSNNDEVVSEQNNLVGLSNELMSLSALLCEDFDEMALQKSHEIESKAYGIPFGTMSYLEELMRSRAEFMEVLQSGTKNI